MKVLVAAAGTDPADYTYTVPGELVYLAPVCARDDPAQDGPGTCGCARAFVGLTTGGAATVAAVADLELDLDTLADMVGEALSAAGWTVDADLAVDAAGEIADIAATFADGTLLRRHLDNVEVA